MPLPKLRPKDMPGWPRMLSIELAAAYMGVSPSHFEREVEAGKQPPCLWSGTRKLWDRHQLDEWQDRATLQVTRIVMDPEKQQDDILRRLQNAPKKSRTLHQYCP